MAEVGSRIPHEALISLRHRLETLPARHADRKSMIAAAAALYGVSRATLYRGLRRQLHPRPLRRSDRGKPKVIPAAELERYCETIAAMKLRTRNGKGRHLSTVQAIRILEEHGVETPDGPIRLPPGLLSKATANRYLKEWGYDHERMTRPPAVVRFQAEHSNALWHFDLSPSDLKQIECPSWIEPGRGAPILMIYSVVDDRSGDYRPPQLLPTRTSASLLARAPHSFSRVFTGAFFDVLGGMFEASGSQDPGRLRQVSREAGRLLVAAVHTAPVAADYYSQVAAAMIQADQALYSERNRRVLIRVFTRRNILSVPSVMRLSEAPVPQAAGKPVLGMAAALDLGTLQLGAAEPDTGYRQGSGETPELPVQLSMLDGIQIDAHLPVAPPRFAVAPAAFAYAAAAEEASSSEMAGRLFLEELIQKGRVELAPSGPMALRGIVPEAMEEPPPRITHELVNEDGRSVLRRLRFQCCPACQLLSRMPLPS
jgi:hypothetical protein